MAKMTIGEKELEPSFTGEVPATQIQIIQALNWYNENKTETDAAKYLGCDPKVARSHCTYAWAVRMLSRGFVFSEKTQLVVGDMRSKFELEILPVTSTTTSTVNPHERVANKTDEFIGELEGIIDEYGLSGKSDQFNAYEWFTKNEVKSVHANKISDYFKKRSETLTAAIEDEDKEYVKAHTSIGKNKIKSVLNVMTNIIKDAERLSSNVNKSRKPRKKKAPNFQKLAAKVLFKEKDDSLKIQSVDPVNIIGADQIWTFNTKTKRLALYVAQDDTGLFLKGSKVIGFSTEKSYAKTLRKPEKTLNSVLTGGKSVLKKLMDTISGKQFALNGSLNRETVILRTLK